MNQWGHFRRIVFVDFEFWAPDGETPTPICVVFRELGSDRSHLVWLEGADVRESPYPLDRETLFVAYYASAELGCHLALGWPMPARVLDLYVEFRLETNGLSTPSGRGLLGALIYHGVDCLGASEKESMRELAMRGPPYSAEERRALLEYCESDVVALEQLFVAMRTRIDLGRALLRGQFMVAAAQMEFVGIPVDVETFDRLSDNWEVVKARLIAEVDRSFGVYESGSFRSRLFAEWLRRRGIPWPCADDGRLLLDDETFKQMSMDCPAIRPIRELRAFLAQLRLPGLAVGSDGRNRCLLSAFASLTGRNQPSATRFIFGRPTWMRGLIQPEPGAGLAYIDWSQQEFGIAAALSGDESMQIAYESGDPYLALAIHAGAVPEDGTKATHGEIRERFKQCVLGVQYGMGESALAARIGLSTAHAAELLDHHRTAYPKFWRWSQAAVDTALLHGSINTTYGWTLRADYRTRWRSIANFPMQANGAEMLRIACILAADEGVRICAPVHDALLIESPVQQLEEVVSSARASMADASKAVLDGFELRTDTRLLSHPERLLGPRNEPMWSRVLDIVDNVDDQRAEPAGTSHVGNMVGARMPTRSLSSTSSMKGTGAST